MRLSPSALNTFNDCPRCFWLDKKQGTKRMRGIMSTLPMGMDGLIKKYFDRHRESGTFPAELKPHVPEGTILFDDQLKLNKWRNWKSTNLVYDLGDGNSVSGMIDELMMNDGLAVVSDYKTRGYAYKNPQDALKYYQTQMDCYGLMCEGYGMKVYKTGYLIYYVPKLVMENGTVQFDISTIPVPINTDHAKEVCEKAINCLESEIIPARSLECEYCSYVLLRSDLSPGKGKNGWKGI